MNIDKRQIPPARFNGPREMTHLTASTLLPQEMKDVVSSDDIVPGEIDKELVKRLKDELGAIILVHNYQRPEIQEVGDYLGDSLGLSLKATEAKEDTIVFCGVDFMAQSAKILNPDKRVIHPNLKAICPMAGMVDPDALIKLKSEIPDAAVVAYVNTTAQTKALSDICCTSANAVKVVKSLSEKDIIFVPDENLALYVQRFVPEKNIHPWPGYCIVHKRISVPGVLSLMERFPDAEVLTHPECIPRVIDLSHAVLSTDGILRYVMASKKQKFIILTEKELLYRLKKESPRKKFYTMADNICRGMKTISVEDFFQALKTGGPEVDLPEDIIEKAREPLERMMALNNK